MPAFMSRLEFLSAWPAPLRWLTVSIAALMAAFIALLLLAALWVAVFGWNWARGPLQDLALDKTGRVLRLEGDLSVNLAWPSPLVRAEAVRLSNPAWAAAPDALVADAVEATIDLREALRGRLAFPELRLQRPQVFLEQSPDAAGVMRKTWLFDLKQTDDSARIGIGRVLLDRGELQFLDKSQATDLKLSMSTESVAVTAGSVAAAPAAGTASDDAAPGQASPSESAALVFKAEGQLRGQTLTAEGTGGAVLAWRDETAPYPLRIDASLGSGAGRTRLRADGSVLGLLNLTGVDVQMDLRGADLAALAPLLGLPLPPTPAYRVEGQLVRDGALWRLGSFTGEVGHSDIAGTLQLDTAGARPMLRGGFSSRRLDLADLGPAVGVKVTPKQGGADQAAAADSRVLPDLPFDTRLWGRLDADVAFAAQSLLRSDAQPLARLQGRMQLQDRRLSLDPLAFDLAGGQLRAQVLLDAQSTPMKGTTTMQLRGVQLQRLLPEVDLARVAIGRLDGDMRLAGSGASLGRMLASADGRVSLVAKEGLISRLLMEKIGLHLLEILRLNLTGDETVALRCAVADFEVKKGRMAVQALVLDTSISTVFGSGHVDLGTETLDLAFVPRTKVTSVIALRSPIYLRGPFADPAVSVDAGAIVTRGLGALALGLLNPLLALVPLHDAGPGIASPCADLLQALDPKARR